MNNHKQILSVFRSIALAQILPAIASIGGLVFALIAVTVIVFYGIFPSPENSSPTSDELMGLGILYLISLFLLSGLMGFLISSYHFISAYIHKDYDKIVKGMYSLNWGWLVLAIFTFGTISSMVAAVIFHFV